MQHCYREAWRDGELVDEGDGEDGTGGGREERTRLEQLSLVVDTATEQLGEQPRQRQQRRRQQAVVLMVDAHGREVIEGLPRQLLKAMTTD